MGRTFNDNEHGVKLRSTTDTQRCHSLPDDRSPSHDNGPYPIGVDESLHLKSCTSAIDDDKGVFYFDQDPSDETKFQLRPKLSANNELDICLSRKDGRTEE